MVMIEDAYEANYSYYGYGQQLIWKGLMQGLVTSDLACS